MSALALKRDAPTWAASYFGIPFLDRGLSRSGCDCWGLCRLIILERTGVKLPEYPEISPGASRAKLRAILEAAQGPRWIEIAAGAELPLDVVLMKGLVEHDGQRHSRPIHLGMVVEPGTLIHIEDRAGVSVLDYRRHPMVRHRVTGFYRYQS